MFDPVSTIYTYAYESILLSDIAIRNLKFHEYAQKILLFISSRHHKSVWGTVKCVAVSIRRKIDGYFGCTRALPCISELGVCLVYIAYIFWTIKVFRQQTSCQRSQKQNFIFFWGENYLGSGHIVYYRLMMSYNLSRNSNPTQTE